MEFITTKDWDEELWQQAQEVYMEAFEGHGAKPERIIRHMFRKKLCCLHLVLGADGSTLAMAITGAVNDVRVLLIDYLAVRNDLRKQGIGQKFFHYIKDWAISQHTFEQMIIEVECGGDGLERIHFWQQCGFVLADNYTHQYIWVPEPYQAMVLELTGDEDSTKRHSYDGEELFKWITNFHKKSFR